jgi:hypothetical protein
MTTAQFADRGVQTPRPVGIGMGPGNVEPIFPTEELKVAAVVRAVLPRRSKVRLLRHGSRPRAGTAGAIGP